MFKEKNRIWEIDFIRGICVILMIIDHFFINMKMVFISKWLEHKPESSFLNSLNNIITNYPNESWYIILKMMVIGSFLIISGISSHFSKSILKRIITLFIFGVTFTIFGNLILPNMGFEPIKFGIISMFALANLLLLIGKPLLKLKNKLWWVTYIIFMIMVMWTIDYCANQYGYKLSNKSKNILFFLSGGFSNQDSYSDYAPLCLYAPVLFIGSLLGLFYRDKKSLYQNPYIRIISPINFIGKHAIIFYVLQIAIIYSILFIITLFLIR